MRLAITKSLRPGAKLGKNIYNERGHILLCEGLTLTQKMINRLVSLIFPLFTFKIPGRMTLFQSPQFPGNLEEKPLIRLKPLSWT